MDITSLESRKGSYKRLINAERNVLISKLIDKLCEGYTSTNSLSKELHVSRGTIENYRPLADEIISKTKLDRNVIRNLQVKRTYKIIEMLIDDLKKTVSVKERSLLYNQIYKFSSHLALITGINIETHVNVDHQKLVIVRANNSGKPEHPIVEVENEKKAD